MKWRLTLILYISLEQRCNLHLLTSKKRLEHHRPRFVVICGPNMSKWGQTPWWSMACHFSKQKPSKLVTNGDDLHGERMIKGSVPLETKKTVASIPWGIFTRLGHFSSTNVWLNHYLAYMYSSPDVCKSWLVYMKKHPNKPIQACD